jgi:hypothetical protein
MATKDHMNPSTAVPFGVISGDYYILRLHWTPWLDAR